MDQSFSQKQTLKYKNSIVILSLISLIFTVILGVINFIGRYYNPIYAMIGLVPSLIRLVPCVLMVIFILKSYRKVKVKLLIPIILGFIAISPAFYWISGYRYSIIDIFLGLATAIFFGLATYSSLKGFDKKIFLIIACAVGLLQEAFSIAAYIEYFLEYLEYKLYLYILSPIISIVGVTALYAALLLFGLKCKMSAIIRISSKNSEEVSLNVLKEKLDLGMITEEEYQEKRATIIGNL